MSSQALSEESESDWWPDEHPVEEKDRLFAAMFVRNLINNLQSAGYFLHKLDVTEHLRQSEEDSGIKVVLCGRHWGTDADFTYNKVLPHLV